MSDQSEALRLAEELDAYHTRSCHKEAAAELRRLHEENERLRADAERYRWHRADIAKHMSHSPEVIDAVTDEVMKRAALWQRREDKV